jgi:hydrogenase maturation protease
MVRKAVIGIGNTLMSDDGIGPMLVNKARERFGHLDDVAFLDEGTIGFGLVHVLKDYDEVIIIDSGDIGKTPGEFKVFSPDDVASTKFCQGYSLHESDLIKVLETSKAMGELPGKVTILAIQPRSVEWREGLSPELTKRSDDYLLVLAKMMKRGP